MMIPITRKEKYINEIVGGGNTAPETPQTREELFFADILGEVVAPSPITRAEKYLAKIANKYSGELPEPVTRVERFLARAAGMDISVPTPVTREEMFWADYAFIVEKEIRGIPPLTFNAVAGALKNYRIYGSTETLTRSYSGTAPLSFPIVDGAVSNYRIYGNTEDGESVGDLVTDSQSEHYGNYAIPITNNSETANIYLDEPLRKVGDEAEYVDYATQKWHRVRKNLFAPSTNIVYGSLTATGEFVDFDRSVVTDYIPISAGIYTFNTDNPNRNYGYLCAYNSGKQHIAKAGNLETWLNPPITFSMLEDGYIRVVMRHDTTIAPIELSDVGNIMLNAGAEALPYEPYIENTEVDVTIPDLPAQYSSNSLSVGTAVQPSSVAVDVDEVVSCCGDRTENLFDYKTATDGYEISQNQINPNALWCISDFIPVNPNTQYIGRYAGDAALGYSSKTSLPVRLPISLNAAVTTRSDTVYMRINCLISNKENVMLNEGSTALPYEPYGYKVPVTVSNGTDTQTTTIYLDTPLAKSGNNADYIDYATQKRHNSDGTESTVILPEIAVTAGTNTLTVGTEVQPSNVYIKYEGAR